MSEKHAATYTAFVRHYQPKGWKPFWAGVTRREGASRVTDICRHHHDAQADAEECAARLAAIRNGGSSPRSCSPAEAGS